MNKTKYVPFTAVELSDGFWKNRCEVNKNTSVESIRARFEETGRFDAVKFDHDKTGKPLHIFYDSDVAKWIEMAATVAKTDRDSIRVYEPLIDGIADSLEKHRRSDGYVNSYFQQIKPNEIFKLRPEHELYCAGHLIEGAIAYAEATGKRKLLEIAEKYCDAIYDAFIKDGTAAFVTPGHEEIELALFKLYEYTGNKKYYDMAEFFLKNRAKNDRDWNMETLDDKARLYYAQDDVDIYNLKEANGHSVRALYFYSAIADLVRYTDDETLLKNLLSVFEDITERKMYITGGTGSTYRYEGFTKPYDLPNLTAYSESCCAVALIMFASRMRKLHRSTRYADVIERVMYNSLLSSVDIGGKAFFYVNPLEIALEEIDREVASPVKEREVLPITTRREVFDCSCCPPNVGRLIAKIGGVVAAEEDGALYVEQYIPSEIKSSVGAVALGGDYAVSGKVELSSSDYKAKEIAVRVPYWCKKLSIEKDGKKEQPKMRDGYAVIPVGKSFIIKLDFNISPRFVAADPRVRADVGRVALMYGPTVYCLEGVDNGTELCRISVDTKAAESAKVYSDFHGLNSIELDGFRDEYTNSLYVEADEVKRKSVRLKFIPYFAFANRGESDMSVWVRRSIK